MAHSLPFSGILSPIRRPEVASDKLPERAEQSAGAFTSNGTMDGVVDSIPSCQQHFEGAKEVAEILREWTWGDGHILSSKTSQTIKATIK